MRSLDRVLYSIHTPELLSESLRMSFFKPGLIIGMLFVLTSGMCWMLVELLQVNPLCSLGFLIVGSMAVVLAVDAL